MEIALVLAIISDVLIYPTDDLTDINISFAFALMMDNFVRIFSAMHDYTITSKAVYGFRVILYTSWVATTIRDSLS